MTFFKPPGNILHKMSTGKYLSNCLGVHELQLMDWCHPYNKHSLAAAGEIKTSWESITTAGIRLSQTVHVIICTLGQSYFVYTQQCLHSLNSLTMKCITSKLISPAVEVNGNNFKWVRFSTIMEKSYCEKNWI